MNQKKAIILVMGVALLCGMHARGMKKEWRHKQIELTEKDLEEDEAKVFELTKEIDQLNAETAKNLNLDVPFTNFETKKQKILEAFLKPKADEEELQSQLDKTLEQESLFYNRLNKIQKEENEKIRELKKEEPSRTVQSKRYSSWLKEIRAQRKRNDTVDSILEKTKKLRKKLRKAKKREQMWRKI